MVGFYRNTVSFVIKLWPVFFLNAGNINKRIGYVPACTIAEGGDCAFLIHAREQQIESPYRPTFGVYLLVMLKNSKCFLFVRRYRP